MNGAETMERIRSGPHWKVRFKPAEFLPERLASLQACNRAVEQSRVAMRGWDYPHLSRDENEWERGQNWIGSMADFRGHVEYWRFYQSAQFVHYSSVREVADEQWAERCLANLRGHLNYLGEEVLNEIRGAFSLKNFTWTIAEIFEFAARLYEHVGVEKFFLEISLVDCQGLALTTDFDRCWSSLYRLTQDYCTLEREIDVASLVTSEKEMAEEAVSWFFERFGWDDQNIAMIRKDLQELYRR